MKSFSERYGYVKALDIIIREGMPIDVSNAICNAFDFLRDDLIGNLCGVEYKDIELDVWCFFMNKKRADFYTGYTSYRVVTTAIIDDPNTPWYKKLDVLEYVVQYLLAAKENHSYSFENVCNAFIGFINSEFERLHYGYRIVNGVICDITNDGELKSVEDASMDNSQGVREHIKKAVELYALRPEGDYRNSIKESISAVEAICRELTGESTLGKAISRLEKNGVVLQSQFKQGLINIYNYTNDEATGIRHAMMDVEGGYAPTQDEAYYMLITCSALVNYFRRKATK